MVCLELQAGTRAPQEVCEGVLQEVCEGAPKEVCEGVLQEVCEGAPNEVCEGAPQVVCEDGCYFQGMYHRRCAAGVKL